MNSVSQTGQVLDSNFQEAILSWESLRCQPKLLSKLRKPEMQKSWKFRKTWIHFFSQPACSGSTWNKKLISCTHAAFPDDFASDNFCVSLCPGRLATSFGLLVTGEGLFNGILLIEYTQSYRIGPRLSQKVLPRKKGLSLNSSLNFRVRSVRAPNRLYLSNKV